MSYQPETLWTTLNVREFPLRLLGRIETSVVTRPNQEQTSDSSNTKDEAMNEVKLDG